MKMWPFLLLLVTLLLSTAATLPSEALNVRGHLLKSKTFLSPAIFLRPGSVSNKIYFDVAFPKGHIALKSFDAEVVDEHGVPVPLHETYLHHWVVEPYYIPKGADAAETKLSKIIPRRNSGVCKTTLGQYYGLGSETRHTATWVPDPYGIEVGDPVAPPEGHEEKQWLLNVFQIDIEYQVEKCSSEDRAKNDCVHVQVAKQILPRGGDIVFGVAHQHSGGIGASLHGEDGRLLCESVATYGEGREAGNEEGYIVGMSTCYPKPGTVTVSDGEALTVVSNYSSERQHTGVMGLFYILVAEHEQQSQL
ncbi:unnamed protein product [Urochloa decumbens]|uniref:Uncharacterized protein n=2 Tax=Urochloa decumbens TaxID=240449 RepID=A0ABC9C2H8_9POAL